MAGRPSNKRWVLIAMALAFTMTMIDATIVSVALPTIQRDLDLSNTERVWIVNAYLLVYTVSIAAAGKFGDRLGQRRIFVIGLVVFTLASAAAGLAPSGELLIAARAVEGLGGAMMTPTSQTMVTQAFPQAERGRALGIYSGVAAVGVAAGPLLGGALTSLGDWRLIFFVNVPVGIAAFLLTRYANPAEAKGESEQPVDWLGLSTLVGGLSILVIALMQGDDWGFGSAAFLGALAASILLIAAFVRVELRRRYPLLQLRIFSNRDFLTDNLETFFVRFALFGLSVYMPIFTQDVLGFSPLGAGAATLPATLMLFLFSPRAGKRYDRIGARPLFLVGSLLTAVGFAWLTVTIPEQSYPIMIPAYLLVGIGVALITTPALTDALNVAPAAQRGEAAGLVGTVQQLGATVGVAVITAVLAPLFTAELTDRLGAKEAAKVQTTLNETQAGTKGPSADASVIADAKDSFSYALAYSYISVIALMLASFAVAFFLHRRGPPEDVDPDVRPVVG